MVLVLTTSIVGGPSHCAAGLRLFTLFCGLWCTSNLPLDLEEATWLVEWPDAILSTEDLIGLRARALAKHTYHVEEMRERVQKFKESSVLKYAEKYKHVIKDY